MGSFMFLGLAMALLAPIFAYACYLDMTLPKKWTRLPVFLRRRWMERRRVALYYVPCLLTCTALVFFAVAFWNDIEPGVRSSRTLAQACTAMLAFLSLLYPVNVLMMRRWMRTGKPKIR